MLQVLKSKRAPAVADLSARLDEINAEIASVIDDIDEAKRRVGSAMLTGDDLEAAKSVWSRWNETAMFSTLRAPKLIGF